MIRSIVFCICLLLCPIYTQAQICLIRTEPDPVKGGGSAGSGFFISENQILTAFHVIDNPGGKRARVEFKNSIYECKILKTDKHKDLALLEVDCDFDNPLEVSDELCDVGQEVTCKGHPMGTWRIFQSEGKIKTIAKTRLSSSPPGTEGWQYFVSMAVTQGMSGGPLLNAANEVVGVLSTKNVEGPPQANFVALDEIIKFLKKQ